MSAKILIVIFFFGLSSLGFSQKVNTTKKQSQLLIKNNLKKHSYISLRDSIKNNYVISFNDSSMTIFNHKGISDYTVIKMTDIDSISIEEKDHSVCLRVILDKGKKEVTFVDSRPVNNTQGSYEFSLNKSFLNEGLPERIGEAFRKLLGFYD